MTFFIACHKPKTAFAHDYTTIFHNFISMLCQYIRGPKIFVPTLTIVLRHSTAIS